MSITVRHMTEVAAGTVLMCICSWITVPFLIPFTLQTFGLFCVLLLLGGRLGSLSVILYLLLGAFGLPVFSGFRGGIGHLVGQTGGYIFGFLLAAAVYLIFEITDRQNRINRVFPLLAGLIVCYATGTVWFDIVSNSHEILQILTVCVFPYVLPDLIKIYLASVVFKRVGKYIN